MKVKGSVTRLLEYLDIYNEENLLNSINSFPKWLKFCQILKYTLTNFPNTLIMLPKWQHIAISGHTGGR